MTKSCFGLGVISLEGWFPLGVDCRRSVKNFLFLYLVLCAHLYVVSVNHLLTLIAISANFALRCFGQSFAVSAFEFAFFRAFLFFHVFAIFS